MMLLLSLSSSSFIFILILLISYIISCYCAAPAGSVPMKIINHSGKPLELFWIDTFAGKKDGTGIIINTTYLLSLILIRLY
jgi:hypothetical protein